MLDIKEDIEKHILWKVGRGDISFWWDNWTGLGPLANLVNQCPRTPRIKVSDFFYFDSWDVIRMQQLLPIQIIQHITNLKVNRNDNDFAIWTPVQSGKFSCSSAWNILRNQKYATLTGKKIWHRNLPFKVSFFMLRLLENKIPTDDVVMKKFYICGPSTCCCCAIKQSETAQHLFLQGNLARRVWKFYSDSCGIKVHQENLRYNIMQWWLTVPKNGIHSILLQCLPTIICWEIWKSRCAFRYDDGKIASWLVIKQINQLISLLLNIEFTYLNTNRTWTNLCLTIENCRPKLSIKVVTWLKPNINYFKLNVDGCSKGNSGRAGGGGILRDHKGNMIMAYAEFYGKNTNNYAEAKAIFSGVQWCYWNNYSHVVVESDSLTIIQMINKEIHTSWQINELIQQIWELSKDGNFHFQHCLREGNMVADKLANLGEIKGRNTLYNQVVSLPTQIRAQLKNDQEGLPCLRIRHVKGQYTFD